MGEGNKFPESPKEYPEDKDQSFIEEKGEVKPTTPLVSFEGSDSDSANLSGTLTPPRGIPSPDSVDPEVDFRTPPQGPPCTLLDPSLPRPYSRKTSPF